LKLTINSIYAILTLCNSFGCLLWDSLKFIKNVRFFESKKTMVKQKSRIVVLIISLILCNELFAGSSNEKTIEQRLNMLTISKTSSINMGGKDVLLEFVGLTGPLGEGRELRILNFSDGRDQFVFQRRDHIEESLKFVKFFSDNGTTCLGAARIKENEEKFLLVPPDRERVAGWVYSMGGMLVLVLLVSGVWFSRRVNKSEG
jgi:hypothetical protein